jgi:hypothetical protein
MTNSKNRICIILKHICPARTVICIIRIILLQKRRNKNGNKKNGREILSAIVKNGSINMALIEKIENKWQNFLWFIKEHSELYIFLSLKIKLGSFT